MSKTILITGANRGVGFAIAQSLATDERLTNPTIIIASRKMQSAEEAVRQLLEIAPSSAVFDPLELDVDNDDSIANAINHITEKHGKLDVLVNNAGIASPSPSVREAFTATLATNVVSVAALTAAAMPLLLLSPAAASSSRPSSAKLLPRVVNVSSARGSLHRVTTGTNPATERCAYGVSKAALNLLTVESAHAHAGAVEFYATNPGWCKTGFNGWRGPKDPVEGARAAVELIVAPHGTFAAPGFWEWEDGEMRSVPW